MQELDFIKKDMLEAVLARAMSYGGDYAEIFIESSLVTTVTMVDRKVEGVLTGRLCGAGVRMFKGLKSVYASTNTLTRDGLMNAADICGASIGAAGEGQTVNLTPGHVPEAHPVRVSPGSMAAKDKVSILKSGYFAAADYAPEIIQVQGSLVDKQTQVVIATSEGLYKTDNRTRTRIALSAVAGDGKETQMGFYAPGALMGMEFFERMNPADIGKRAAKQAVTMLKARPCPPGRMAVAIENGFGGVIFHEACGHSLEASSVAKGNSEFAGKLGQQIASTKVTAIDDGTIPGEWGSTNIDDEGTPSRRNVLIENGILKGYMVDKLNARRMETEVTGSSRRQSYAFAPTSRMTNTFIAAGKDNNADIIKSMDNGLYAAQMGGGSVNPVTGEFNFAVSEGYLVRGGEICEPVRGASLIGKGGEVLMNIDMVGTDMQFGQGMCGSSSGSVPTNVGQPLIRVREMTVGGSSAE